MPELTIWHNPRCSKSRQALAMIEAAGIEPEVRLYLEHPPGVDELDGALRQLGLEPWELARLGEQRAAEIGLHEQPREDSARGAWLEALSSNPRLIERPVVLSAGGRGVLGRPPDAVGSLLE